MAVQVDDAMVRRAALAFYRPADADGWVVPPILARNMRRALEAAMTVSRFEVASEENRP